MRRVIAALLFLLLAGSAFAESWTGYRYTRPDAPEASLTVWFHPEDQPRLPQETLACFQDVFFNAYPAMRAEFGAGPVAGTVYLLPERSEAWQEGMIAFTQGERIFISLPYLLENPQDADVLTHEMFHVLQGTVPGIGENREILALCEGLADYARAKYGLFHAESGFALPAYAEGTGPLDGYRTTAAFLTWTAERWPSLPAHLNDALRQGTYSAAFWLMETGHSLDGLWQMYAAD